MIVEVVVWIEKLRARQKAVERERETVRVWRASAWIIKLQVGFVNCIQKEGDRIPGGSVAVSWTSIQCRSMVLHAGLPVFTVGSLMKRNFGKHVTKRKPFDQWDGRGQRCGCHRDVVAVDSWRGLGNGDFFTWRKCWSGCDATSLPPSFIRRPSHALDHKNREESGPARRCNFQQPTEIARMFYLRLSFRIWMRVFNSNLKSSPF